MLQRVQLMENNREEIEFKLYRKKIIWNIDFIVFFTNKINLLKIYII